MSTVQLVEGGHLLYASESDPHEVDDWVLGYDFHNGPGCALCEGAWCHHCQPERDTEPCPALQEASLLPVDDVLSDTYQAWRQA